MKDIIVGTLGFIAAAAFWITIIGAVTLVIYLILTTPVNGAVLLAAFILLVVGLASLGSRVL